MKKLLLLSIAVFALFATSCKKDDPSMPDNTVNLSATEIGFDTETSKSFSVSLDRTTTATTKVVINLTESGVAYDTDYTTLPVAVNGEVEVLIPAGETTGIITVTKKDDVLFDGDEYLQFAIKYTSDETLVMGATSNLKLSFGAIVSTGNELTLNGGEGGSSAANSVFVDFSNNEQTAVARKSWNLGFSCGTDFAVILNNTTASTAKEVAIAIGAIINATDSATFVAELSLSFKAENFNLIDDINGDLSKTVIKEEKVYVVNLGESQTPLYKIKVSKKDADTYTLQYAKSNESSVKSIDITKDSNYTFKYVSFAENKIVSVAPQKAKWDMVWGKSLYKTVSGSETIPYAFADLVLLNISAGVQAVEVVSADANANIAAYASMNKAVSDALTFSTAIDVIGSKWRNGGGPSTSPSVKDDRFYVIKDAAGNAYKLQFTSIGDTRGYPKLKYELLK
ncbi:MAG: HmuY family protein [Paludibacteraceae bacterium]